MRAGSAAISREVLPDGRVKYVYPYTVRYVTPKPRTSGPKAEGRKGVYYHHEWFDDLPLLPDEERVMPETVSDDEKNREALQARRKARWT